MVPLLPSHRAHLRESGLSDETIDAAQVASCTDSSEAAALLNWTSDSGPAPAIVFPHFTVGGERVSSILRPDVPWRRQDGSEPKYESPRGEAPRPYFPPAALVDPARFQDEAANLVLTEGIKKALALAQSRDGEAPVASVALLGVDMAHDVVRRRATGQFALHPDLSGLPLDERPVFIAFDGGDTSENLRVIVAEARLARMLLDRGAEPRLIRVPYTSGGPKVGIDDYLAGRQDRDEALRALMTDALVADPLARCRDAIRAFDPRRRDASVIALLNDNSFAAALFVGGDVVVDLVAESLGAVGIRATSVREALSSFENALARQSERTAPGGDSEAGTGFTPEIEAEADALLRDPLLVDRFHMGLSSEGVVGEQNAATMLLLAMVTRRTKRPVHVVVKAASSSGKNFLAYRVASRIPTRDVVLLTDLSPRSLLFQKTSMKGKVFIVAEHEGAERAEYSMRVAMSEGSLAVLVAERSGDSNNASIETRQHQVEGPACFITTTTRASLHDENETRVLEVTLDESEDQTRRIINGQADRAINPPSSAELDRQEHDRLVWQCAMGKLELTESVNPGANDLLRDFPTKNIRARRDFQRVLDLAAAHALLHQCQRQAIEGRVVVDRVDIQTARELCESLYSTTSPRLRNLASRLREHFGTSEFTTAQAAANIGYNIDALRRTLGDMEGMDLVRKTQESRGSKAARWQLTVPNSTPPGGGRAPSGATRPASSDRTTPSDTVNGREDSPVASAGCGQTDGPTAGTPPAGPSTVSGGPAGGGRAVGPPNVSSSSGPFAPAPGDVAHGRSAGQTTSPPEIPPSGPITFRDEDLQGGQP